MLKKLSFVLFILLSACAYKIDIQQGNILAQKDIDKLRLSLTKNQVVFVLGNSVVNDSFDDDKWVYLYSHKDSNEGTIKLKKLELAFVGDKLITAFSKEYDIPKELVKKK